MATKQDSGVIQIEPLLTVRQAAEVLNESMRTVQRRLTLPPEEAGSLPYIELPSAGGGRRRIRFRRSDLVRWIELGFPPASDFRKMNKSGPRS